MSEGALSKEAMLAGLEDIRLPADASGGLIAELAVAVGLAAMLAAAVLFLIRLFGVVRPPAPGVGMEDKISALRDLPDADRRLKLLHLMKERAPERYAAVRDNAGLYRPDGGPDLTDLEAELRTHG